MKKAESLDGELVARAVRGDGEAFGQLVRLHQNRVYGLALRMLKSPADAEDAAQDAFIKAWENLSSFRGESAFSTWLYRLTSNVCLDMLAARARRPAASLTQSEEDGGGALDVADPAPGPQELAERGERAEALARAMEAITPEARLILTLREGQGLSYEEIGQALSLPPGTVKSKIFRARERLREELLLHNGNIFVTEPSKLRNDRKGGGEK